MTFGDRQWWAQVISSCIKSFLEKWKRSFVYVLETTLKQSRHAKSFELLFQVKKKKNPRTDVMETIRRYTWGQTHANVRDSVLKIWLNFFFVVGQHHEFIIGISFPFRFYCFNRWQLPIAYKQRWRNLSNLISYECAII